MSPGEQEVTGGQATGLETGGLGKINFKSTNW